MPLLVVCAQGATRAFPPHHPLIPVDYQFTGQPVLIGGTMARRGAACAPAPSQRSQPLNHAHPPCPSPFLPDPLPQGTCSYILTGTDKGMEETFGSTCHGAGRARSRNNSRTKLDYQTVLDGLKTKGISIRVASPKLVMEEAPESYKDVTQVVDTCHAAGISRKTVKLRPVAVIKG